MKEEKLLNVIKSLDDFISEEKTRRFKKDDKSFDEVERKLNKTRAEIKRLIEECNED